ncbi:GGDEF domain-containing protein [Aquincola tertiaricarbonis]|uniref:diguanylate cyclase n=1 Tax=Aquincola tertiaricarbonis TaxID=391953 RepID=A0ABY4S3T1_AQUTE|nr:GGDEF domain-containing protein [Aquincola tertiaricarbonis]URI08101.1 GGDEF domain-containing protein [Aquincola tertiaricarbonis]
MKNNDVPSTATLPEAGPPTTREHFAQWRQAQDIRQRTRLGGFFYLVAWCLCWGFASRPGMHWAAGLMVTALFALLLLLRLLHRLPRQADVDVLRRWALVHWNLLLATALSWGLASSWVLATPDFGNARLVAVVSTVAFATAMVFTFAMNRPLALLGVAFLSLPGIAALAWHDAQALPVVLTLVGHLAFLVLALRRGHAEYHAHTAMAFELLDQRERFRALSRTDGLTQLGNRLHFNQVLPEMAHQAQRSGQPLSLAMFDIDWFKRINDTHGHAAGDACLIAFSGWLRTAFAGPGDVLVRLGGEEFGVLMPGTTAAEAWQRAEAFRHQVSLTPVAWRDRHIAVTTSGGVGTYGVAIDGEPEHLVQRVDRALYTAKARGRNQVTQALGDALPPQSDLPFWAS